MTRHLLSLNRQEVSGLALLDSYWEMVAEDAHCNRWSRVATQIALRGGETDGADDASDRHAQRADALRGPLIAEIVARMPGFTADMLRQVLS